MDKTPVYCLWDVLDCPIPRPAPRESLTVRCSVHVHQVRRVCNSYLCFSAESAQLVVMTTDLNGGNLPGPVSQRCRVVVRVLDFVRGDAVRIAFDECSLLVELLACKFGVHSGVACVDGALAMSVGVVYADRGL